MRADNLVRPSVSFAGWRGSPRATILGSLLTLNREFGISLVYITHDLTTAYQVSEDIIVLYRGSVAEAGDVQRVVGQPEHPYTRLLGDSIPLPNPDHPWLGERALGQANGKLMPAGESFCKFHARCPHAMPICVEHAPPLFRTDPRGVTACYLYREFPAVPPEALADVLSAARGEPGAVPPPSVTADGAPTSGG